MAYQKHKRTVVVEAVDIVTMSGMSLDDYGGYLADGLLEVDHRGVQGRHPLVIRLPQTKSSFVS